MLPEVHTKAQEPPLGAPSMWRGDKDRLANQIRMVLEEDFDADTVHKIAEKLAASFGAPVPERVLAYWDAWVVRPSWKEVYEGGCH